MQDKGRGSLTRPPASHTAPQSGSGLFHRWSEFSLFAVAGGRYQKIQREKRSVSPFCKVTVIGGFLPFHKNQRGGHFSPPGGKSGVSFSSALTAATMLAGPGGGIRRFCAAKQRIKVLEKSSSYLPQSVVCVGVAKEAIDMRTILEDLYYGNITPNEQQMTPGSELKRAVDRVAKYGSLLKN